MVVDYTNSIYIPLSSDIQVPDRNKYTCIRRLVYCIILLIIIGCVLLFLTKSTSFYNIITNIKKNLNDLYDEYKDVFEDEFLSSELVADALGVNTQYYYERQKKKCMIYMMNMKMNFYLLN
jgi:hypothetical protein